MVVKQEDPNPCCATPEDGHHEGGNQQQQQQQQQQGHKKPPSLPQNGHGMVSLPPVQVVPLRYAKDVLMELHQQFPNRTNKKKNDKNQNNNHDEEYIISSLLYDTNGFPLPSRRKLVLDLTE